MGLSELNENLLRRAVIGDLVTRSALRFTTRIALVYAGKEISFRTLNEKSCQAANSFLKLGIKRGDRVAFMTHNCLNYIYCRLGLAKIGAIPVPLNFMLRKNEIAYIVKDSQPKLFFVEDTLVPHVEEVKNDLKGISRYGWFGIGDGTKKPDGWMDSEEFFAPDVPTKDPEVFVDSDDVATIMYTTGTESFPKGVMTTHFNYFMSMFHLACDCDFKRDDVMIIDIPLFHVAGTTLLMGAITFGSKAIIEYAPDPVNILKKTVEHKVTMWVYPPTLYQVLPMMPNFETYDLSSLKKFITFGTVLPPVVHERWKTIKPDLQWRNYWGQTESSPVGTTSSPEVFDKKIASIGIPDTGATVKVFDDHDNEVPTGQVGELVIRGPFVMKGYWKNEKLTEKTLRNGWLHTGDMGYIDEDGYIIFKDRKKDMIKTGGENVSSQEVEGLLLKHPKVAQAAVIGMPDPHWTEAVTAFVVRRPNEEVTEQEIIAFAKDTMAAYKVPKKVIFMDQLPMTPTGKILKREIRDDYQKKDKK